MKAIMSIATSATAKPIFPFAVTPLAEEASLKLMAIAAPAIKPKTVITESELPLPAKISCLSFMVFSAYTKKIRVAILFINKYNVFY